MYCYKDQVAIYIEVLKPGKAFQKNTWVELEFDGVLKG